MNLILGLISEQQNIWMKKVLKNFNIGLILNLGIH